MAALKIWRPTGSPTKFTPVAESVNQSVPGTSKRTSFSSSISVRKGDVIGIAILSGGVDCYYTSGVKSGDTFGWTYGDPTSGKASFSTMGYPPGRLNLSVRFAPNCVVPNLKGKTLKAAKKALKKASCTLGTVNGLRTGTVKSQKPGPGKTLKPGAKVNVRLG
jgi:hypothetical protein